MFTPLIHFARSSKPRQQITNAFSVTSLPSASRSHLSSFTLIKIFKNKKFVSIDSLRNATDNQLDRQRDKQTNKPSYLNHQHPKPALMCLLVRFRLCVIKHWFCDAAPHIEKSFFFFFDKKLSKFWKIHVFTPPWNRAGVKFSLHFVCVFFCLSVCLVFSCEQNSSRTHEPIWTRFSLNGCLPHWLETYWNWWP